MLFHFKIDVAASLKLLHLSLNSVGQINLDSSQISIMRIYAEDDYAKGMLEKMQLWHSRGHQISSAFGHIQRKSFTVLWFFSETAQTTRHECRGREERVSQVRSHL